MMPGGHWGLGNGEGSVQEHDDLPDGQLLHGAIITDSQLQQTVTF